MFAYLQPKILERAGAAGDDVLSQLVNNTYKGRSLYPEEMIGICSVVLTGGLDTTASTLGFIARYLADNPEMRTELVAEPEKVENAVNEFLRPIWSCATHSKNNARRRFSWRRFAGW